MTSNRRLFLLLLLIINRSPANADPIFKCYECADAEACATCLGDLQCEQECSGKDRCFITTDTEKTKVTKLGCDAVATCAQLADSTCCETASCNKPLKCYTCANDECEKKCTGDMTSCPPKVCDAGQDRCLITRDSSNKTKVTKVGCEKKATCDANTAGTTCCENALCNKPLKCYDCTGEGCKKCTGDMTSCPSKVCDAGQDRCLITRDSSDKAKVTKVGCEVKETCDANTAGTTCCENALCNKPLKCYHCTGNGCAPCTGDMTSCPTKDCDDGQQCFTTKDDKMKVTELGCKAAASCGTKDCCPDHLCNKVGTDPKTAKPKPEPTTAAAPSPPGGGGLVLLLPLLATACVVLFE